MTKDARIKIEISDDLKQEAEELFAHLGMDLETAINVFLHQSIHVGGFPFELRIKKPNALTRATIEAAERGEDLQGPFDSVSALMEDLND